MADRLHKYPRTQHIRGSRLQPGDEDADAAPFAEIAGRFLVIEEKLDGANAGVSFSSDGALRLQSRGHFLVGGPRERQWDLFKTWATCFQEPLRQVLSDRYVLFGEWLYAKHTVFYDRLPHYFFEFDVLDTQTGDFLSTERRRRMLGGLPLESVRVLRQGEARSLRALTDLIGPSLFKGPDWREALAATAREHGVDPARAAAETDPSDLMEGVYVKVEEDGRVVQVRPGRLRPDAAGQRQPLGRSADPAQPARRGRGSLRVSVRRRPPRLAFPLSVPRVVGADSGQRLAGRGAEFRVGQHLLQRRDHRGRAGAEFSEEADRGQPVFHRRVLVEDAAPPGPRTPPPTPRTPSATPCAPRCEVRRRCRPAISRVP